MNLHLGKCSVDGCDAPEEWHQISHTANYIITVRYCEVHLRRLAQYIRNGVGLTRDVGTVDPELRIRNPDLSPRRHVAAS